LLESNDHFIPWENPMHHDLLQNKDLWLPQVKGIDDVLSRYTKIKLIYHAFWSYQCLRVFLTS